MTWFGVVSFQLMFYYDNLLPDPFGINFIQILGFYLPLISSPILYMYVYSFSLGSTFIWKKQWIHLLPFAIFTLICFYLNLIRPNSITFRNGLPIFRNDFPNWLKNTLSIPLALIPGLYIILSLRVLLRYQK